MELSCAARHSMDSPEWYTPSPFVEAARLVMGSIDLDPASHEEANWRVKAAKYYTEADNGLMLPWGGNVFLNPPGGAVREFWRRLMDQRPTRFVWIGYSLEQLQTLQAGRGFYATPMDYPICIVQKRIAFVENKAKHAARLEKLLAEGEAPNASDAKRRVAKSIRAGGEPPNSPSHSNYISYGGENIDRFVEVFSRFGQVKR